MSLLHESIAHDIREFHNPHGLKERAHDFVMMPARAKWFLFLGVVFVMLCVIGIVVAAQPPTTSIAVDSFEGAMKADSDLVFEFSRPMSRRVNIDISPSIPGNWYFEGRLSRLHLAQTFHFEPLETWFPDTTYTVTFQDLHNVFGIGQTPETVQYTFTTQPAPIITNILPAADTELSPQDFFTILLDQPNTGLINIDFCSDPEIAFDVTTNDDKTEYRYTPQERLSQGTRYNIQAYTHATRRYRETGDIAFEGEAELASESSWKVQQAPGVASVSPTGSGVFVANTVRIDFDKEPIESAFQTIVIKPDVSGAWTREGDTAVFTPTTTFAYETKYSITVPKDFPTTDGGYFEEQAVYTFTTIGSVQVVSHSPGPGAGGVAVDRQIRIDFDQSVNHVSAQEKFSITPNVDGTFAWDGATMIYTPSTNLSMDTGYTIRLADGIGSVNGLPSNQEYAFTFTTQPSVVELAVPLDFQDRSLSCEAAALKMALAYKGVNVSETDIMHYVGYDATPHTGSTWGNPYNAFVGSIDGRQSTTGYGVYWEPIARAANIWRSADYFVNGTVQMLTEEISKGNPVVVWGNAGSGTRVDWYTTEGQKIYAFNGEHARTVKGYIGPKDNPTHIIVNDPIYGKIVYTTPSFEANWAMLFKAGVVVR